MTLYERLLAELDRREQITRDHERWPERVSLDWPRTVGKDALVAFWNTHGAADALRRYAADRERLEEHGPCRDDDDDPCGAHSSTYQCCACHSPGPCSEQYLTAHSLGIEVSP